MARNFKDTNNARHIDRRVHFLKNCDNCKIHRIEWFEGGMHLADISNNIFDRMI